MKKLKKTELRSIALSKIQPNLHRDLDKYPWNEDKISSLMESIDSTGFWPNLTARAARGGKVQIAYGHHRIEALRRLYPDTDEEINVTVSRFTDDEMLRMMVAENHEHWANSATTNIESVRAVMKAAEAGQITLPVSNGVGVGEKQQKRNQSNRQISFSVETIAQYLGWLTSHGKANTKAITAYNAILLEKDGFLVEEDLEDISADASRYVTAANVSQKKVMEAAEVPAKTVKKITNKLTKFLVKGFKEGTITQKNSRGVAKAYTEQLREEEGFPVPSMVVDKPQIDIDEAIIKMGKYIENFFAPYSEQEEKMEELLKWGEFAVAPENLVHDLDKKIALLEDYRSRIQGTIDARSTKKTSKVIKIAKRIAS